MKSLKDIMLVIVLLIVSAMGYMYFTYPGKISRALSYQISASTGVDVEIDSVKVKFFKGVVKIKHINVKNSPQYRANNIFEIAGVYAKFSPASFFKKEIILDEVVIYSPRVYLEQDSAGVTNFRVLFAHAAEHAMSTKGDYYFLIRDLEIRNLEVEADKNFRNKAHDIEEIVLKNIGAKESGYTYPRLVLEFFDILDRKALAQYSKAPSNQTQAATSLQQPEIVSDQVMAPEAIVPEILIVPAPEVDTKPKQSVNINSTTVVSGKNSQLKPKPAAVIEREVKELEFDLGLTQKSVEQKQPHNDEVSSQVKKEELERYNEFFAAP